MVDYIGVSDIQRLVRQAGTGEFIERLAREIEADYRRWSEFENPEAVLAQCVLAAPSSRRWS